MRNTISDRYVDAVARHLVTRLHPAKAGTRCRCGHFRHTVLVSSLRSGIPGQRLVDALPPEPAHEREMHQIRRMTAQLSTSMRVLSEGQSHEGPAAILALVVVATSPLATGRSLVVASIGRTRP